MTYLLAVQMNPSVLANIPEEFHILELYASAIQRKGCLLRFVPEMIRHVHFCEYAVKSEGMALEYVPVKLRTEKLCKIAVANCGQALKYVPEALRDTEILYLAVSNDGSVLQNISPNYYTYELCLKAVQNTPDMIGFVPVEFYNVDMIMAAIVTMPGAIMLLDTPSVARVAIAAIQRNGEVLKHIPADMHTHEMYLAAVESNGKNVQMPCIKTYLETLSKYNNTADYGELLRKMMEIYNAAVKNHGAMLSFVPMAFRSRELCISACENDSSALKFVPANYDISDMYRTTLSSCNGALKDIPRKHMTDELLNIAILRDPANLKFVPAELCTIEMCYAAVKNDGRVIVAVPPKFRSEKLYALAMNNPHPALDLIPETLRTEKLCDVAIWRSHHMLQHVPKEIFSFRHCIIAMDHTEDFIEMNDVILKKLQNAVFNANDDCRRNQRVKNIFKPLDSATVDDDWNNTVKPPTRTVKALTHTFADAYESELYNSRKIEGSPTTTRALQLQDDVIGRIARLKNTVADIRVDLNDCYEDVMSWISALADSIMYVDIQEFASALRTLSNVHFREIVISEISGYRESCNVRSLTSINNFYAAWKFYRTSMLNGTDSVKLEIILGAAKTIALNRAISTGLVFYNQSESVEIFPYMEARLQKELKLLTIVAGIRSEHSCDSFMSLPGLVEVVRRSYLEIAADHPLLDNILDNATIAKIGEVRSTYEKYLWTHLESVSQMVNYPQYERMVNHYKNMVAEDIRSIKIKWLMARQA
jgi:hypothetical protein